MSEYVDALLKRDFVAAASLLCSDVVIEPGEFETDLRQLEADEGRIVGVGYGRVTDRVYLSLDVRKGDRKATVTFAFWVVTENGRLKPCPPKGHPLGWPTD